MPPKKRSAYAKSRDDGEESPQASKRTKTTATVLDGKKCTDDEGNPYWELGGRLRRVTVSEFKGKHLVSIREHYEKDGKVLPGKKGISLSVEQFNALLRVLPQLDECLAGNGVALTRPVYEGVVEGKGKEKEAEEEEEEEEAEEKVEVKVKAVKEEEEEEEEVVKEEEEEEEKPKRLALEFVGPKQKAKPPPRQRRKKAGKSRE